MLARVIIAGGFLSFFGDQTTRAAELTSRSPSDPASACSALKTSLSIPNTTVLNAIYYSNTTTASTLGLCASSVAIEEPLCRLQFIVDTSDISNYTAEVWLPTSWNGRFLTVGNTGLRGCIDYAMVAYGAKLNFAAVGSNSGHEGNTGKFFGNTEVLADFAYRSIHTETVIGKQVAEEFYGQAHNKSYYLGCSTGGRQGVNSALHYPEDFDGIVVGSPATDFLNLVGQEGMLSKYVGAPDGNASASFIPADLWDVVAEETLNQCDALDGVTDGIITEPDDCDFKPETLLCSASRNSSCLTKPQVEALKKIYSPLYGKHNDLIYPRFNPGAEAAAFAKPALFYGGPFQYTVDWWSYVVYNNTNWNFSTFGVDDIYLANKMDPYQISTHSGDMSAFKARGGKLVSYHGQRDDLIPAAHSKLYYDRVSETMKMPNLDSFYRLFLVPGLNHCFGGVGATNVGQNGTNYKSDDPKKNVLLAVVDWVENGVAPETITGISDDGTQERVHCRYPQKSVWNGSEYVCQA